MSEAIEAITTAALSLALDAASLRHQAISANIANAGTEGYVPVRVTFEAQLEEARAALRSRGALDAAALADVRPALVAVPPEAPGVPARIALDVEMAAMARNGAHAQALLAGVQRHLSILSMAVNEARK